MTYSSSVVTTTYMQNLKRRLNQRADLEELELSNTDLLQAISQNQIDLISFLENSIVTNNAYYCKKFLQQLIGNLEQQQDVLISRDENFDMEELYNLYISLMPVRPKSASEPEIIKYPLIVDTIAKKDNDSNHLTAVGDILTKETPKMLNGFGSTGFRTWAACLYLAEYLCKNFDLVLRDLFIQKEKHAHHDQQQNSDKDSKIKVLELGAGTGLLSMTLCKNFHDKISELIVTDGSEDVLELLRENLQLNGISENEDNNTSPSVRLRTLWWGKDPVPKNDIVFAADVTYDSSALPYLTKTLAESLEQNPDTLAFVSCTIRNDKTIKEFEDFLDKLNVSYEAIAEVEDPNALNKNGETLVFHHKREPEIRIYKLRKLH